MSDKTKAHTQYKLDDGTRVPSVTTILGVLAKPALIHWAWKLGIDGQDYRAVRDTAADIGTLAHYLILCHLNDIKPDTGAYSNENIDKAHNSVIKFFEWEKDHNLKPILLEEYLVSGKYRFGGTIDCYGYVNEELVLLDFKTSSAIYPEMFYQLAAYELLLQENGYEVHGGRILRIGRSEEEGFEDRDFTDLSKHKEVFLNCLNIYDLTKAIKREFK